MDFFEHQDVARRKTSLLVFYFAIAVGLIIVGVYVAVAAIFLGMRAQSGPNHAVALESLWNPLLLAIVAGATVLVIAVGSLYKISSLQGGGEIVARQLGGRPIDPNTHDLDERVVLNVVEEMAIASGTPVPPVFLLDDEPGINAFAAGFSPNDGVVGVTRGAIESLSRDELQGVIAHEFSHILNGDMRLNIQLMGVLHGILLIALIGYGILRSLRHVRVSSRGSKKGGGGGIIIVMILLGLAFLIIGYIGVFFGKLIKSAVSRQREFLADASAVQFTRNPGGLGGALRKIGGHMDGSRIQDETAEEASHLFFGNALRASLLNAMSTHPPLEVRIKRIDPMFDGTFPKVDRVQHTARDLLRKVAKPQRAGAPSAVSQLTDVDQERTPDASFAFQPDAAIASVGTLDPEHVDYALQLVASIPDKLNHAVHEPLGAVATVCCLLLDENADARRQQLQSLSVNADGITYDQVRRLMPLVSAVNPKTRLPLVEMAVPALCRLSDDQYRRFAHVVRQLIEADRKISFFEFALHRVLLRQLDPHFVKQKRPSVKFMSLHPLLPSCGCLLSTLAHAGHRDESGAGRAFAHGAKTLVDGDNHLTLLRREECGLDMLASTLDRLAQASPQIKKRVLRACAVCIDSDGQVAIHEAELLRLIAISLDCPMPPLLDRGP